MYKKIILVTLSLFSSNNNANFNTLDEALQYAAYYPETPEPADPNILYPDYASFYKTMQQSWRQSLLSFFGLKKQPLFDIHAFKHELEELITHRQLLGYTDNFAIKINFTSPTITIYAWGPLGGQFHSLVRALKSLYDKGIIDNKFAIKNSNTYFIFNGNAIDGSPYNIEILDLLFQLLKVNPTQVFYIKGYYESEKSWLNYTLKHELRNRISALSYERVPLESLLDRFFNTLPLAVYVNTICDITNFVRFSYFGRNHHLIQEEECIELKENTFTNDIQVCKLQPSSTEQKPESIFIKAIIKAEDRLMSYKQHGGLTHIEPDKGSSAWTLFSGPNFIARKFFEFYNDAYAEITIPQQLEKAKIALYVQDAREQFGFTLAKEFNLITGQTLKTEETFQSTQEPLYIGCTLDLSRSLAQQGEMLKRGVLLKIDKVNEEGGIKGRPIQVIFMDDGYTPERARQNIQTFIKTYNSSLTLASIGSPTLEAYLDLVKNKKVFVFFPNTGAPIFRDPTLTNLVHWRASYQQEGKELTHYVQETYQAFKFVFIYQDDSFGKGALQGALEALENIKDTQIIKIPYAQFSLDIADLIKAVKEHNPRAIGFFSTPLVALEFLRKAPADLLTNKKLFGLSDLSEDFFLKAIAQQRLSFVIAQVVPPLKTVNWPLLKEYQNLLTHAGHYSTAFTLEGFISASLMVDILQKIDGEITDEKINTVLETMKNYDYQGMKLNFNPQTRELTRYLWLYLDKDKWITIKNE